MLQQQANSTTADKGNKAQKIAIAQKQTVQWLVDSYEIVHGGSYPKAEVYKDYLAFCKQHSLSPTTAPAFGKVIRMAFPNLQCRRKGPRGEAKHHYRNFAPRTQGGSSNIGGTSSGASSFSSFQATLPQPAQASGAGTSSSHKEVRIKYEESTFAPTPNPSTSRLSSKQYNNTRSPDSDPQGSTQGRLGEFPVLPSLVSDDEPPRVLGKKRSWEASSSSATGAERPSSARKEPRVLSPADFKETDNTTNTTTNTRRFTPSSPPEPLPHRRSSITSILNATGPNRSASPRLPLTPPLTRTSELPSSGELYLPPIDESVGGGKPRLPDWYLLKKVKQQEEQRGGGNLDSDGEQEGFHVYLEAAANDVDKEALLEHLRMSHAKLQEKEKEVEMLNNKLQHLEGLLLHSTSEPTEKERREFSSGRQKARELEEVVSKEREWLTAKGKELGLVKQTPGDRGEEGSIIRERGGGELKRGDEGMKDIFGQSISRMELDKESVDSNPWDSLKIESAEGAFRQLRKSHLQSLQQQRTTLGGGGMKKEDERGEEREKSRSPDSSGDRSYHSGEVHSDSDSSISDGVDALVAASRILSGANSPAPKASASRSTPLKENISPESRRSGAITPTSKKDTVPLVLRWIRSTYERIDPNDPPSDVPKEEVYENYKQFCYSHGIQMTNSATFGKLLRSVFPDLKTRRLGSRGNTKHHYNGIRLIRDPRLPLDISDMPSPPSSSSSPSPPQSMRDPSPIRAPPSPAPQSSPFFTHKQSSPPQQTQQFHSFVGSPPATPGNSQNSRLVIPIPVRRGSFSSSPSPSPSSTSIPRSSSDTSRSQPSSPSSYPASPSFPPESQGYSVFSFHQKPHESPSAK